MKNVSLFLLLLLTQWLPAQEETSSISLLASTESWLGNTIDERLEKLDLADYTWEIPNNDARERMPFYRSNFNPKDVNFYISSDFQISLNWRVNKESGVSHYEVEKFGGKGTFMTLQVIGAKHASGLSEPYMFYDQDPFRGTNNYRITQVMQSGERKYAPIYSINYDRPVDKIILTNTTSSELLEVIADDERPISIFFFDKNDNIVSQHAVKKRGQINTSAWPKGVLRYDVLGKGYEAHGFVRID